MFFFSADGMLYRAVEQWNKRDKDRSRCFKNRETGFEEVESTSDTSRHQSPIQHHHDGDGYSAIEIERQFTEALFMHSLC